MTVITKAKVDKAKIVPESVTAKGVSITIPAPRFQAFAFKIQGESPYVQASFSEKSRLKMAATQQLGERAKKGTKREPRNFEADYLAAMHVSREGWNGIPASAFRNAMISACRISGFAMTRAKLSVFVLADGFDRVEGVPLVKIIGKPHQHHATVRNDNGAADIRVRPMWTEWSAVVRVEWDADQFGLEDVTNLLLRAGRQVGIGEGRPDSKSSNGLGWGLFRVMPE
jgi:hypothetical protein